MNMNCWPIFLLSIAFGAGIGALFVLMVKAMDWGNDAELRLANHTRSADLDEHSLIGENDAD